MLANFKFEKIPPILLFGSIFSYTFIRLLKEFPIILLIGTVPLFRIVEYTRFLLGAFFRTWGNLHEPKSHEFSQKNMSQELSNKTMCTNKSTSSFQGRQKTESFQILTTNGWAISQKKRKIIRPKWRFKQIFGGFFFLFPHRIFSVKLINMQFLINCVGREKSCRYTFIRFLWKFLTNKRVGQHCHKW